MKKVLHVAMLMMLALFLVTGCSKKEEPTSPEPTEQAPAVTPDEAVQTGMEVPMTESSYETESMETMDAETSEPDTLESEAMGTSGDEGMMLESTPAEDEDNTVQ